MSKLSLKRFTFKKFIVCALLCVGFVLIFTKGDLSFKGSPMNKISSTPKNRVIISRLKFNEDPENYNAKLQIIDEKNNDVAEFDIAIADSNKKRLQGLMHLDVLPQKHGMIFLFENSQVIAMWMKNTLIPLDMIFIDENNIIVNIKTNTTPHSLDIISSVKEVSKVLEINAGLVDTFGIKVGHRIVAPQLDKNIKTLPTHATQPEIITQ